MNTDTLILDLVYEHEASHPDRIFLTQPLGGGRVQDLSWGQVLDQARRMAAHLQGLGLPRGARVAMLSKNCAHFIVAELAIWIGGYTTVAIFPTEKADTVRYVRGVFAGGDGEPMFGEVSRTFDWKKLWNMGEEPL